MKFAAVAKAPSHLFGQVYTTQVPYSDQLRQKSRPVVIVSTGRYSSYKPDVLAAAITSKLNPCEELGEFAIEKWQQAGLYQPSAVKAFIVTIGKSILKERIGELSIEDQYALQCMLALSFAISQSHASH